MATTHKWAWMYPGVIREKKYFKHRYMTSYETEWTQYYLRDVNALVQAWKDENYWKAISNAEEIYQFRLSGFFFIDWTGQISTYNQSILPSDRNMLCVQSDRCENMSKVLEQLNSEIKSCEQSTQATNDEKESLLIQCKELEEDIAHFIKAVYSLIPAISVKDTHVPV